MRLAVLAALTLPLAHAQSVASLRKSAATNGSAKAVVVVEGLNHPWAMAFLPGEPAGRMLVTARAGNMRIVSADGKLGAPLAGLPVVHAVGQGGLLDVVASPDFLQSRTIYFSFAQPVSGRARTAVASAQLAVGDGKIDNAKIIFAQADIVAAARISVPVSRSRKTAACSSPRVSAIDR